MSNREKVLTPFSQFVWCDLKIFTLRWPNSFLIIFENLKAVVRDTFSFGSSQILHHHSVKVVCSRLPSVVGFQHKMIFEYSCWKTSLLSSDNAFCLGWYYHQISFSFWKTTMLLSTVIIRSNYCFAPNMTFSHIEFDVWVSKLLAL